MIRGLGVSDGIVIAKAICKKEIQLFVEKRQIEDTEAEVERLTNAVYQYTEQLEKNYKKTLNVLGDEEAAIHKNHLNILKDSVVIGGVKKQVRDNHVNAEFVLNDVKVKYENIYNRMDDDFLRKKAEYIKNITEGIIKQLLDNEQKPFDQFNEPFIIVAKKLDATDTIELEKQNILGIILEDKNKMGHGAILAKNWKIPCVVGVKELTNSIQDDDLIILDGKKGEVIINPDAETLGYYNDKLNKVEELDKVYHTFINEKTQTTDGYEMDINAIVSNLDEVNRAVEQGADNIGLFRTEALFVGKKEMPSEEMQYETYSAAVEKSNGKELYIRTFDCNGKSDLPYIHLPEANNPALGYFSTRIALRNNELLLTQLKAILRVGGKGKVKFVVPMISSVDELLDINLLIEDAKLSLEEEGKAYDTNMKHGVILETPSVAIITNFFARDLEFLYVDVDDMLMYVTGIDPTNEMVFELYDEFHPGFLRILRSIVKSAHREGTSITFSGRLCTNELLIPIFIAMGVDAINIKYKEISKTRWEINSTNKKKWEALLDMLLKMASGKDIKMALEKAFGNEYYWNKKS